MPLARKEIMIVAIIAGTLAASAAMYISMLPGPDPDVSGCEIRTADEYQRAVYGSTRVDSKETSRASDMVNFLWDVADADAKTAHESAPNLSMQWPPRMGTKARLTAFPYPPTAEDGSNAYTEFARGMAELLNNTQTSVSFPGWLISIYDPSDPNDNSYRSRFDELGFDNARVLDNPEGENPEVWLEILHACYPPPKQEFPICDDGDYWMYMAPGSGVFWKTPKRCIVAANKIDAYCLLLEKQHEADAGFDAEQHLADWFGEDGRGGGMTLVTALKKVLAAVQRGEGKTVKTVAFRGMESGDSRPSLAMFCVYVVAASATCLGAVAATAVSGYHAYNGAPGAGRRLATYCAGSAALVAAALAMGWFVVTEHLLRGFGYCTLDQARMRRGSKVGMKEFIHAARIGKPYANGLCMTQLLDIELEKTAKELDITTVIMHAQPNKSGNWSVEIMSYDYEESGDGLCGGQTFMYQTNDNPDTGAEPTAFSFFTPQQTCRCDGKLKSDCTFCEGHVSAQLCIKTDQSA